MNTATPAAYALSDLDRALSALSTLVRYRETRKLCTVAGLRARRAFLSLAAPIVRGNALPGEDEAATIVRLNSELYARFQEEGSRRAQLAVQARRARGW